MLVSRISPAPRSTPSRAQRRASRAVSVRPPRTCTPQPPAGALLRVDREHDALRAELRRELVEQLRARDRGAVDRDLVGAGVEHRLRVGDRADAAADRERHEHVVGGAPRELDDRVALLVGRRDVEEDELVGAAAVVERRQLDRVAGVADVDEARALDDAPGVDVQARDHALQLHRPASAWAEREAPLVQRLADDHAGEPRVAQRHERLEVGERADPAGVEQLARRRRRRRARRPPRRALRACRRDRRRCR